MFHWALVSRRSRLQTGSRFFSRGSDTNGNVSNFCETEQIVEYNGQSASYVQTRGSMPFFWSQRPCIKYMPKPIVTGSGEQNKTAMKAHYQEQKSLYGKIVLVNLINQSKYEGKLEETFRDLVANVGMSDVFYEAFDFHKECSKMRYDRLSLLGEQLSAYRFGYFSKTGATGHISLKQVSRTVVSALAFLVKNLNCNFPSPDRKGFSEPTAWIAWIEPMLFKHF